MAMSIHTNNNAKLTAASNPKYQNSEYLATDIGNMK